MKGVFVHGLGAVSPGGWGVPALREALALGKPVAVQEVPATDSSRRLRVRTVPPATPRPPFMAHPRMRRTSPITQFALAAASEALGADAAPLAAGSGRLGIVFCVATGCVNYCRRFFDETLRDPATASPLLFPETVFNAPSSHLGAYFGTTAVNYTLVGDPPVFLQGVALAGAWLGDGRVDACLVVGAEETDWLTSDAFRRFSRSVILSEGAGALYLRAEPPEANPIELLGVTSAHIFFDRVSRRHAADDMRRELSPGSAGDLLSDGLQGSRRLDEGEEMAWRDWPGRRLSLKRILGEGLMAATAWQCVAAVEALRQGGHRRALVSAVGCTHQAIGVEFRTREGS